LGSINSINTGPQSKAVSTSLTVMIESGSEWMYLSDVCSQSVSGGVARMGLTKLIELVEGGHFGGAYQD
jgi:hypothetical protein